MFDLLQALKDLSTSVICAGMAQHQYWSRPILTMLFSLISFVNTIFVSYSVLYVYSWSAYHFKDSIVAFGLWVFVWTIWTAPSAPDPGRWPIFFWGIVCCELICTGCRVFSYARLLWIAKVSKRLEKKSADQQESHKSF